MKSEFGVRNGDGYFHGGVWHRSYQQPGEFRFYSHSLCKDPISCWNSEREFEMQFASSMELAKTNECKTFRLLKVWMFHWLHSCRAVGEFRQLNKDNMSWRTAYCMRMQNEILTPEVWTSFEPTTEIVLERLLVGIILGGVAGYRASESSVSLTDNPVFSSPWKA